MASHSLAKMKRAQELAAALASRNMEALALYRPMPIQEQFHRSMASEVLLRGGNQSGKSTSAFIEVASAATGTPLIAADGSVIPFKYPTLTRPKPSMLIWLIGYGSQHIGDTIYRYLFTEDHGLSMIKDEHTGRWRAWNPTLEYDAAYEEKARAMPPLIPPRALKGGSIESALTWDDRGKRIFYRADMANGAQLRAFTSSGEAKQGDQVDLIHIDEDIERPGHVMEWLARLSKRRGRLIWSAFPHSTNHALNDMSDRAEKYRGTESPPVEEFVLTFSGNPFMPAEEKEKRIAAWAHAGELDARDKGMFQRGNVLVYPNLREETHGLAGRNVSEKGDADYELDQFFRADPHREPPNNWTRFLALDPGHKQPAVLFAAIPPPNWGDWIVLYDELYPTMVSPRQLADMVARKIAHAPLFEQFIIDYRAGRQTPMGAYQTVAQSYAEAFRQAGVFCRRTRHNFTWGTDNVQARINLVRSHFLDIRPNIGSPRMRFVTPRLKNFIRESKLYRKKVVYRETTDDPVARHCDLMNAMEYLAGANPKYTRPEIRKNMDPVHAAFLRMQRENSRKDGSDSHQFSLKPLGQK